MQLGDKLFFKEICWVLVIKLVLVIAIRMIFFSNPAPKSEGTSMTASHLLGASAPAVLQLAPANRRSYDQ